MGGKNEGTWNRIHQYFKKKSLQEEGKCTNGNAGERDLEKRPVEVQRKSQGVSREKESYWSARQKKAYGEHLQTRKRVEKSGHCLNPPVIKGSWGRGPGDRAKVGSGTDIPKTSKRDRVQEREGIGNGPGLRKGLIKKAGEKRRN